MLKGKKFDASALERAHKVIVPRPKYMRTPTEGHAYPDRGTCVPRPRDMRTPTEGHAYPDRGTMTLRCVSHDF